MKRIAAILGIVIGFLIALGAPSTETTQLGVLILIVMSFVQIFRRKPFAEDLVLSILILVLLPMLVCQLILTIGWPYIIIGLVILAIIYIFFNTHRGHGSKIAPGGERMPLDHHFFDDSWDDLEVN